MFDQIRVFEGWWSCWGYATQWVLPSDISDHCSIILKNNNQLQRPKPFKFNNHQLSHDDFSELVLNSWFATLNQGWKDFVHMGKLRYLKVSLKGQNREVLSNLDCLFESLRTVVQNLNVLGDQKVLSLEEMYTRFKTIGDLWVFSQNERFPSFPKS